MCQTSTSLRWVKDFFRTKLRDSDRVNEVKNEEQANTNDFLLWKTRRKKGRKNLIFFVPTAQYSVILWHNEMSVYTFWHTIWCYIKEGEVGGEKEFYFFYSQRMHRNNNCFCLDILNGWSFATAISFYARELILLIESKTKKLSISELETPENLCRSRYHATRKIRSREVVIE